MVGFAWFFKYSRLGLAMRATAFDQQVAQSLGISVKQVFAMAWAISAVVSALAGVVVGMVNGVSSALSFFGIKVFPAVILGGLDSIVGAIVGGLIIGVLENLAQFVDSQYPELRQSEHDRAVLRPAADPDDQAVRTVRHQEHREESKMAVSSPSALIPAADLPHYRSDDRTIFPTAWVARSSRSPWRSCCCAAAAEDRRHRIAQSLLARTC